MKKTLLLLFFAVVFITSAQQDKDKETLVLICSSKTAYAYHRHECRGLKNCKAVVIKITLTEAKRKGYKPCGYCYKN